MTVTADWTEFDSVGAERIIQGEPRCRIKVVVRDERFAYGLWEVTPGTFALRNTQREEFVHITRGRGSLTSETGVRHTLEPGAMFVIPRGFNGVWLIEELVTKAFCQFT